MKRLPTIYTLSLNPCLDKSIIIKQILFDDINRINRFQEDPGGKGINVSRVLSFLGGSTLTLGFSGGATGKRIEELLSKKKVPFSFIKINEETRLILNIFEDKTKRTIRLNEKGPKVGKEEIEELASDIFSLPYQKNDYFVCSGSLTPGVPPSIYQKIIKRLKKRGVRTVLDSDNEPFRLGVKSAPFLIKPNLWELSRLSKKNVRTIPEIITFSKNLLEKGIKIVLTSLGKKGAILVAKKETLLATPPQIRVKSTIGSGDAFLAGFLFSLTKGRDLQDALRFGVALGTATALQPGTAICQKKDIYKILRRVKTKELI
ncbi:MAG: 1-phosphofructokinase [Candidatus Omnitrophica bacterium]|nr:1-phosphofructokinase [Candidatus Omnitrophota bacterium]